MELYIWNYLELYGTIWTYFELYGTVWNYLELFGAMWNYTEIFGTMELYGAMWNLHGTSGNGTMWNWFTVNVMVDVKPAACRFLVSLC